MYFRKKSWVDELENCEEMQFRNEISRWRWLGQDRLGPADADGTRNYL